MVCDDCKPIKKRMMLLEMQVIRLRRQNKDLIKKLKTYD